MRGARSEKLYKCARGMKHTHHQEDTARAQEHKGGARTTLLQLKLPYGTKQHVFGWLFYVNKMWLNMAQHEKIFRLKPLKYQSPIMGALES